MRFDLKFTFLLLFYLTTIPDLMGQHFQGKLVYESYRVLKNDTIESSTSHYWFKDHLSKHKTFVVKAPLVDLGTLYANADKMTRINMDGSGNTEMIGISLDSTIPLLKVEATGQYDTILNVNCQKWNLIDITNETTISSLWITNEIRNTYFDQFVELFNYQHTLFPCKKVEGWILKREDYRRKGEVFVTEIKDVKSMELSLTEMMVY